MKILAIGAHPDDIEVGCAGTLFKLKEKHDAAVTMLVLANNDRQRNVEQKQACKLLDIPSCISYNFQDTAIPLKPAILAIENIVEQLQPDYIFTHHENDTHQDHRTVSKATLAACRNRNNILFYESFSTEAFTPTLLVDIEKHFSKKCEVLSKHKSQSKLSLIEYAETLTRFRAHRTGLKRVEGFVTRKFIWM